MPFPQQARSPMGVLDDDPLSAAAAPAPVGELALRRFLDERGIGHGPVEVEPLGAGHSNLTFALRRGEARLVLRRPPRPPYPASAHDVLREARLLEALAGGDVRTPRVRGVCPDPAVIGAPFYLMDHIDGVVIGEELPPALSSRAERRRIGHETVDALAEIHAVDWLGRGVGRPRHGAGYLERQLRRFGEIWATTRTREVPLMDQLTAWLWRHRPEDSAVTLVHGDYRLGNVMFANEGPARLAAVLDWELWAIGDPLADIGYLVATWAQPDDPPGPMRELCPVTELPGFPTRDELVARYEQSSRRAVGHLRFYRVLALWKSAVFLEGSFRRYREGRADDPFFARLSSGVPQLVRAAHDVTRGADG